MKEKETVMILALASYIGDKLGHLSSAERAVMEPILKMYQHVFHRERSNEFKSTDLVEQNCDRRRQAKQESPIHSPIFA
jgi:hypothetical protein